MRCQKFVTAESACVLPVDHDWDCTIGPVIEVDYKNWKGVRRIRRIIPTGKMMFQSMPPWHVAKQWLIAAIDCEDGKHKFFGADGFYSWRQL